MRDSRANQFDESNNLQEIGRSLGVPEERLGDPIIQKLIPYVKAAYDAQQGDKDSDIELGRIIDINAYEILSCEVPEDGNGYTNSDIKSAYRVLSGAVHTDINPDLPREFLQVVNRAYNCVKDQENREFFDAYRDKQNQYYRSFSFTDFIAAAKEHKTLFDVYPWDSNIQESVRAGLDPFIGLEKSGIVPDAQLITQDTIEDFAESALSFFQRQRNYDQQARFLFTLVEKSPELYVKVTSYPYVQDVAKNHIAEAQEKKNFSFAYEASVIFNCKKEDTRSSFKNCKDEVLRFLNNPTARGNFLNTTDVSFAVGLIDEFQLTQSLIGAFLKGKPNASLVRDKEILGCSIKIALKLKDMPSERKLYEHLLETMRLNNGRNTPLWNKEIVHKAKKILSDFSVSNEEKVQQIADLAESAYPLYQPKGQSRYQDFVQLVRFKNMFREVALNFRSKGRAEQVRDLAELLGYTRTEYKRMLNRTSLETLRWAVGGVIRSAGQFLDSLSELVWRSSFKPNLLKGQNLIPRDAKTNFEKFRAAAAWIPRIPGRILIGIGNLIWNEGLNTIELNRSSKKHH